MSQENYKSPKNDRRKSILVQKQIDEVVRNTRRVSFRNLKEVQYFDKDVKNNPDLLHNASPLKEKINDTLGSDGIFTPGRTTISEASSHSSKNNTADMFGDGAKKPRQSFAVEEPAKFEIQESPPANLEMSNYNTTEMSIANSTVAFEVDMSMTKDASQLEDTLDMFSRSVISKAENKENSNSISDDTLQNDTAQIFESDLTPTGSPPVQANTTQNVTMDMFDGNADASQEAPSDETMAAFKTPVKNVVKGRVSLSTNKTMSIFDSPNQTANSRPKRVSMSTTMAMFPEDITMTENGHQKEETMNDTAQMFNNSSVCLPPALEQSVPMDITELMFNTTERNGANEQTDIIFADLKDKTLEETTANVTEAPEYFRNGTPTLNMFQNSATTFLLTPGQAEKSVSKPSSSQEGLSRTLDALMTATEKRCSSVFETARGMNFSLNYSDMIEKVQEVAPREKTLQLEEKTDQTAVEDVSMNISLNLSVKSKRASILSQSIRSRRRSSLNSTLLEHFPSPSLTTNLNVSKEEQLSFVTRNSLFDIYSTQISYPEPKKDISKRIHDEAVFNLEQFITAESEKNKRELDSILPNLREKAPEKVAAIETLNSRKLGPIDKDIMMAARNIAESEWLQKRSQIARNSVGQYQKVNTSLEQKLNEVQEKALVCEKVFDLRDEVQKLEDEWKDLNGINVEAVKCAEEEHKRLEQEIRDAERRLIEKRIKDLEGEDAFLQRKMKEADMIYKVLLAAQKERQINQQLMMERLRNYEMNLINKEIDYSSMEVDE